MILYNWNGAPKFGREVSLKSVLGILRDRVIDPTILEVGTSESYNLDGLGNAIIAFAWVAGRYGGRVISVDAQCVVNAEDILKKYVPQYAHVPEFHLADIFDFAPAFHDKIDLLYVDAGFELASEPQYGSFFKRFADRIPSFYVEMFKAFNPECFYPGALMLFDDTDNRTFCGKGEFLIPYLLQNGWREVQGFEHVPVFPMVLLEKK